VVPFSEAGDTAASSARWHAVVTNKAVPMNNSLTNARKNILHFDLQENTTSDE
jgi:hypothetical protein